MTRSRITLIAAGTLALAMALPACGNASNKLSASTKPNTFVLREWSIGPPAATLRAGKLTLTATNSGSETHELVILRLKDPASLPTKSDGSVDEEKISEADKAGEIGDVPAGKSVSKDLDLVAGDYVAICNLVDQMGQGRDGMSDGMSGGGMNSGTGMSHVHYQRGMVTRFTVT